MSEYYILEGKETKPTNLIEWGKWYETADRRVNETKFDNDVRVSTVFLGMNHAFDLGTPLLFETMIFGGKEDGYCERYTTWEEAEKGHLEACLLIENKI